MSMLNTHTGRAASGRRSAKKLGCAALAAGALLFVSTAAHAWSCGGGLGPGLFLSGMGGGGSGHMADPEGRKHRVLDRAARMLGRLNATAEQRDALNALLIEMVDASDGAWYRKRALRREWLTEMSRPELNEDLLEDLEERSIAFTREESERRYRFMIEAGKVFTAEQRERLIMLRERQCERKKMRKARRGGRGGDGAAPRRGRGDDGYRGGGHRRGDGASRGGRGRHGHDGRRGMMGHRHWHEHDDDDDRDERHPRGGMRDHGRGQMVPPAGYR